MIGIAVPVGLHEPCVIGVGNAVAIQIDRIDGHNFVRIGGYLEAVATGDDNVTDHADFAGWHNRHVVFDCLPGEIDR